MGRPASRAELAWYGFASQLVLGLCRLVWRTKVVGRERVPQTTAFIVAPVHRSYIDSVLAAAVTRRRLRFMGKEEMWSKRWAGKLWSSFGAFPVRRGKPDREALLNCQKALGAGEPVVLFPEGRRVSGPVVQPLLDGPAFLALRANVPIVPVGIGGSERAMPKGAKWVHRARVTVVVGKPIWPPARPQGSRVPRRAVAELTATLQAELQVAFDEAQRLAGG
jgi:1-acyl-sn-glycerol-3-phosphate acyltransferase